MIPVQILREADVDIHMRLKLMEIMRRAILRFGISELQTLCGLNGKKPLLMSIFTPCNMHITTMKIGSGKHLLSGLQQSILDLLRVPRIISIAISKTLESPSRTTPMVRESSLWRLMLRMEGIPR